MEKHLLPDGNVLDEHRMAGYDGLVTQPLVSTTLLLQGYLKSTAHTASHRPSSKKKKHRSAAPVQPS
jgi:hypothetical protein